MVAQRGAFTARLAARTSLRRVQPTIDLGPVDLQTFGICFAAAFLGAGALLGRRLKELGLSSEWAYEAVFAALIGGLIGSRVDFLIQNWDQVSDDLFGSIFSGSGLVWFGGLIGGAAGVLLWGWRRGFFGTRLVDACAPSLALGYAIGRIGCQLSGDGDYGEPSDLPWAMAYPDGTVPTSEEVHPTPVYETLAMGLVAVVLWRLRDRLAPGCLFALYLLLAGLERFLVEIVRRNESVVAGLTLAQLISLAMMAGGAAWLIAKRRTLTVAPAR
jgi:phosphatidylglycerol---prolipoprotein diacylglyceryl transferase